jgi:hypothetical protein
MDSVSLLKNIPGGELQSFSGGGMTLPETLDEFHKILGCTDCFFEDKFNMLNEKNFENIDTVINGMNDKEINGLYDELMKSDEFRKFAEPVTIDDISTAEETVAKNNELSQENEKVTPINDLPAPQVEESKVEESKVEESKENDDEGNNTNLSRVQTNVLTNDSSANVDKKIDNLFKGGKRKRLTRTRN